MAKNLILFFSQQPKSSEYNQSKGNTALTADLIQELVEADLFEVETVIPYPDNYKALSKQARQELNTKVRPALKQIPDLSTYENIFVCGPCWWGTYPMALFSALENQDFTGKAIYPVITHEGSGAGTSIEDLKEICINAIIQPGLEIQVDDLETAKNQVKEYVNQFESFN